MIVSYSQIGEIQEVFFKLTKKLYPDLIKDYTQLVFVIEIPNHFYDGNFIYIKWVDKDPGGIKTTFYTAKYNLEKSDNTSNCHTHKNELNLTDYAECANYFFQNYPKLDKHTILDSY